MSTTATLAGRGHSGRGWAYAGAILGGAVSVAANVAHSYIPPDAGWPTGPPVAPRSARSARRCSGRSRCWSRSRSSPGSRGRRGGGGPRFGSAGCCRSPWSPRSCPTGTCPDCSAHYGEDAMTSHVGPLAVDGLMILATAALLATSARPAVAVRPSWPTRRSSRPRTPSPSRASPSPRPPRHSVSPRHPPTVATATRATPTRLPGRLPSWRTRRSVRPRPAAPGRPDQAPRPRPGWPGCGSGTRTCPTTEIANRLGVTDRTVRRHLAAGTTPDTPEHRAHPPEHRPGPGRARRG